MVKQLVGWRNICTHGCSLTADIPQVIGRRMVAVPSRMAEIDAVAARSRSYLDMSAADLDRLFEEALDEAQAEGLPGRSLTKKWRLRRRLSLPHRRLSIGRTRSASI
jgi:hypothetical protein